MNINDIREKVEAGRRLSFDDGLFLEEQADLFTLGELANLVRERKNGNVAYYNVNTHLNPTNVCVYRCIFCAFRADLKSPKGYVMTDEQILHRAAEAERRGATELHIVGGLHHQLPYEWYLNVVRIIHQPYPRLHLKAYTAVEWDWFARLTGRPTRDILAEFKDAGLGSLPGGGAEIFHPEVRDNICEHKADAERLAPHPPRGPRARPALQRHHALRPHREAACTASTTCAGCASCRTRPAASRRFIPLAFHPDNTKLAPTASSKSRAALMDLRTMAISRLMLDNFPHIKAYWVMLGIKTAQLAAELRRRRHRRHGGPREDLPRRRLRLAAGADRGRAAPADRGSRPRAGGARHAVPRSDPAGEDWQTGRSLALPLPLVRV